MPFKVIQGHRGQYQSKARMQLPISDLHYLTFYTVGHKKHTKMCFAITFVKLDGL